MARLRFKTSSHGKEREHTFELSGKEVSIGRAPDNDIVIARDGVSRYHARIRKTPGGYLLVDNQSTNGVFVGIEKIHEHLLRHDEVFLIEDTSFHYSHTPKQQVRSSREGSAVCGSCGATVHSANKFCTACGAELDRIEENPENIREKARSLPLSGVIGAVVVACAALLVGGLLLGKRFFSSPEFSAPVASLAPELAGFGDSASLHGDPQSFTAGPEGGRTTLSDGSLVEVPKGVLDRRLTFQGAVIDLELPSAEISSARVYLVATKMKTGPLRDPVVLEIPVSVSSDVTFAWYDNSEWLSFPVPDGPKARIQFRSFSRRYVAVMKWATRPTSTSASAGAPVPALDPSPKAQVLGCLNRFLNQYRDADFSAVTSLGDAAAFQRAMNANLDVEINPSLGNPGKYTPGDARWFGRAFSRDHLLEVKELKNDAVVLKTLWHEYLHHLINLQGGEACGPEEAYMDLLETRSDWLNLVRASLDRYMRSVKTVDPNTCAEIQRRWKGLVSRWENTNGNHLSGPYAWQDPKADNSCGEPDKVYTISADFIKKWDGKLGVNVDAERIRSFYEQKISGLPASEITDCNLRAVSQPKPAPKGEDGAPPPPKNTSLRPSVEEEAEPCPVVEKRVQKCAWSPDGYKVDPCPPGYCFDTGPRGSYICVQIDSVPNGRRSYTGRIICNDGFLAKRDPCSGLIRACVEPN